MPEAFQVVLSLGVLLDRHLYGAAIKLRADRDVSRRS